MRSAGAYLTRRATVQKFVVATQFIDVLNSFADGPSEEVGYEATLLTSDGSEGQIRKVEGG